MDFYNSCLLDPLCSFDTPIVVEFFFVFYKALNFETKDKFWCSLRLRRACYVSCHVFVAHV